MTPEQLEQKVNALKAPNSKEGLEALADDQIFALLAYEFWKDGMDWDLGIEQIALGHTVSYNTREKCIHILVTVFGY